MWHGEPNGCANGGLVGVHFVYVFDADVLVAHVEDFESLLVGVRCERMVSFVLDLVQFVAFLASDTIVVYDEQDGLFIEFFDVDSQ